MTAIRVNSAFHKFWGVPPVLPGLLVRAAVVSFALLLQATLFDSSMLQAQEQASSSLRMASSNTSRQIPKRKSPSPSALSEQTSVTDLALGPSKSKQLGSNSKAISKASATASSSTQSRSIVETASYEEAIIPSALTTEENFPVGSTSCDQCESSSSMLDYMTSDKSCGSHYFLLDWSRADLWVGTTSYVNPGGVFNNGAAIVGQVEGSFGFQEGFNFGSQLPSLLSGQIGSQLGMRFVQSNLEGSGVSTTSRNQMFATAGLFRRVDYGFQGGAVVDYFHQQWIESVDLYQVRGELSFLFSPVHELGFRASENFRTSRQRVTIPSNGVTVTSQLRTLDTYRLFGRRRFGPCAANVAEVQLGTSSDGGVLLSGSLQNPLTGQLGLESSATYYIPKNSLAKPDTREAWSLSMAIIWTPGRRFGTQRDYYRPLFEVAGNGSLIATRP